MQRIDRRESLVTIAAAIIAPGALLGCGKKPLTCMDTSGLTPDELTMRVSTLGYTDTTLDPQKVCASCRFFKPAGENQCGGCQLVKGPINPGGSCKSWIKKG
jgi:hypothetical protein